MQSAESIYIFIMSSENQKALFIATHWQTPLKRKKNLIKNTGNAQKHPGSSKSSDAAIVCSRHRKWVSPAACERVEQELWLHILKLSPAYKETARQLRRQSDDAHSELRQT